MFSLRRGYVDLLTSGSYLILLVIGIKAEHPAGWVVSMAVIAMVAFFAWMSTFQRSRSIADTPTSRIASAAQGYVEIYGQASRAPEYRIQAQASSLPCVWFKCVTYERTTDNKWREVRRQLSDSVFEVSDDTGRCMIDPEYAEVITSNRRTWYEGPYKYVEDQLFPMDRVYALGEFSTIGGSHTALDVDHDVRDLLAAWKADQPEMLRRFDLDGDGRIDLKEWQLARNAAKREVERQHRALRLQPEVHVMRKPRSGQLYLLSNFSPSQLHRRYLMWSLFHLTIFFSAVIAGVWISLHLLANR